MNQVGVMIKELRKKKNITQEQLGEVLSVSFQTISKWENGLSQPDIYLLPVIASYFGVSIDEIFGYRLDALTYKERFIKFIVDNLFESEWYTLSINYPLNEASLLKAQVDGFEEVNNKSYKYRFDGSTVTNVQYETEFLVGGSYNLYYILGQTDEDSQKFEDISLLMELVYISSSNETSIKPVGRLITVKKASTQPVNIVYCFRPIIGDGTLEFIYISFSLTTRTTIKNLTTTSPSISTYAYDSISANAINEDTGNKYCDEYGLAHLSIGLNPTNADVEYTMSWSASQNDNIFITVFFECGAEKILVVYCGGTEYCAADSNRKILIKRIH